MLFLVGCSKSTYQKAQYGENKESDCFSTQWKQDTGTENYYTFIPETHTCIQLNDGRGTITEAGNNWLKEQRNSSPKIVTNMKPTTSNETQESFFRNKEYKKILKAQPDTMISKEEAERIEAKRLSMAAREEFIAMCDNWEAKNCTVTVTRPVYCYTETNRFNWNQSRKICEQHDPEEHVKCRNLKDLPEMCSNPEK